MSAVILAVLIGTVAAFPLALGAWIAIKQRPSSRIVGFITAFGAGALISAIAYELVLDATKDGRPVVLVTALALGAITYFLGSEYLDRRNKTGSANSRGLALLMGAMLDGIPESLILGIAIAAGGGLRLPFLVAAVVSNLREGMASAAELARDPDYSSRRILVMWAKVVGISAIVGGVGAFISIPEARERAGLGAGLAAVFGFAVAFTLHQLGA